MAKNIVLKPIAGNTGFHFTDNRPEAIAQRKLQEEAANSPRTKQLKAFAEAADNDPGSDPPDRAGAGTISGQRSGIQKNNGHNGLPEDLKAGIEDLSGYSMDDVTVHYNSGKPAQLQAFAYAQGNNIHLGAGQEKHLPHEAWHVVQQKQGRVKPTLQLKHGGPVNTDVNLEREADRMGQRAMKQSSSAEIDRPVSMHKHIAPDRLMIQCVWKPLNDRVRQWDPQTDGVTWYADNNGDMWFEVTAPDQVTPDRDYKTLEGEDKKRSWVQWNAISIQPTAEFNSDVEYNDSLETMEAENTDPEWTKWHNYINSTIKNVAERDKKADVRKDFDPTKVKTVGGGKLSEAQQETVKAYIANFKIVTRQEFNLKLWEMAEKLARIKKYSCIVSEPGKSNHWITARVLKKVKFLGGSAPQKIISVPAKEEGDMDRARLDLLSRIPLDDAGDIVFLDDGSFSGSQLFKLINNIVGSKPNNKKIGLVARSTAAEKQINEPPGNYLNNPIPIEIFKDGRALDDIYKAMGWVDDLKKHGDHLLGFYSKIPDHQSVRYKLLAKMQDADHKTAITGYTEAEIDMDKGKQLGIKDPKKMPLKGGTEPYKALHGTKADEQITTYSLSDGESKAVQSSPADIQKPAVKNPLTGPLPSPHVSLGRYSRVMTNPKSNFLDRIKKEAENPAGKSSQAPGSAASSHASYVDRMKLLAKKHPVATDSKDQSSGAGDVIKVINEEALPSFLKDPADAQRIAKEKEAATGQEVTGSNSKTYKIVAYNNEKKEFTFKLKTG